MTRTFYHVTPRKNLPQIMEEGLYSPVYMLTTEEQARKWHAEINECEPAVTLRITLAEDWTIYNDPLHPKGMSVVSYEHIPSSSIVSDTASILNNPAESYFHGTYNSADVAGIISEGLTAGSSVSSRKGQATAYPIIFEYTDLAVEPVYYRPGDFKLTRTSKRPIAIYVSVAEFGAGVRNVDEINEELSRILERLESQGVATPERVGELMVDKDNRALKELDERLPHIAKEMDAVTERGPSPGGEDIFRRIMEQAGSVPVYRIDRDEEGEIDWGTRRR